jgi:capsular polysaccharide transport system permease protein
MIVFVFMLGRAPPFGNQPVIFFGISVLPFVIFVYPARQILIALPANRPLLYFPRVKIVDVFVARGLLEFANGMAVAGVVCATLYLVEGEFAPRDPLGLIMSLVLTLYLGFAWGAYNALISHLFHFWAMAVNLMFPLLWIAGGIVYNIHGIPAQLAYFLSFNPLLQCIEYIRYAYCDGYPDDLLDVGYVFWFATCFLAATFAFERMFRRQLLAT